MNKMQNLVKFWLPVIFWLVMIYILSSRPTSVVSEIDWRDFFFKKTLHLIEFGILFVLFYRAFKKTTKLSQVVIWAFLLTAFYAISDEYHQTFVPGRTGNLRDVFIDSGGALIFGLAIWKCLPKAPTRLKNWAKSWQLI